MKKAFYNILQSIVLLLLSAGCKRESLGSSSKFANAYTRMIMIDAPGQGKVQFTLDGKLNANGDSTLYNADGTVYQPDPRQNTTTTVNYPSGGWTDNAPVNFSGTYGFNYLPGSQYSTFPNPTNRVPLAPIIGGINYYNWASLPAAQHQLSFYTVINATVFGNPTTFRADKFLDESISLEGGAAQTFFLINKSVAKSYITLTNTFKGAPLPIYSMNESISYLSNQLDILTVKDHPGKLPAFKDSTAYIRLVNVTPKYLDQSINQSTDTLDIYIAPIYGVHPDGGSLDDYGNLQTQKLADSVGKPVLVCSGLPRFQSVVDAPFFEINVAENMRIADSLYAPPAPGKKAVPRYYRVMAYRTRHSPETDAYPLAIGDWLAVFNKYDYYDYSSSSNKNMLDSWLLRTDGTYYHPTICTILISVGLKDFVSPYPTGNAKYLGVRSSINYQKAGVNGVYFEQ
ncbi:MAG: hypothetical protein J0H74_09685 [Chitinophagaceae bacterium]|nr:hypothetical protein [Chitinophagaceae bacterium]